MKRRKCFFALALTLLLEVLFVNAAAAVSEDIIVLKKKADNERNLYDEAHESLCFRRSCGFAVRGGRVGRAYLAMPFLWQEPERG